MRIVSYRRDGEARYGIVDATSDVTDPTGARIADVCDRIAGAPVAVEDFLRRIDDFRKEISDMNEWDFVFEDLDLLPAVPHPQNIICIGVNYVDHASETGDEVPSYPLIFTKFTSSIAAHGTAIRIPRISTQPDYEAELGLVISAPASNVSYEDALDYVGGYFTFNDVSARDVQNRTSQWVQGKGFPSFAPTGPYLVTADEVGDPQNLEIRLTIGDIVRQKANTRDMVFDVRTIVSYVSSVCDLRPGDIIATGTPSGVGVALDPPRFLTHGDIVKVEIDRLPTLVNEVEAHE
ncbi:fumarylacetoacetate hydrolase family protein [Paramicrobacterium chengjingii]|uniref:fumarylacetoacetate hydrolase family protein n=1 Tax=Paramicrobacterium chengjingii TaxID=2769067 RepID=UPI00141EB8C3|nr:fumarylacetoacetate hydrolase family protein [Microbacterium chengjingii]